MTMAVLEQSKTTTTVTLNQAYRYALDPTSEQVSLLGGRDMYIVPRPLLSTNYMSALAL